MLLFLPVNAVAEVVTKKQSRCWIVTFPTRNRITIR